MTTNNHQEKGMAIAWMVQQTAKLQPNHTEEQKTIIEMFNNGKTSSEIAKALGVSEPKAVLEVEKVLGKGAFRKRLKESRIARNRRIVELFEDGVPASKIWRQLSISRAVVNRVLANYRKGFPIEVCQDRKSVV